VVTATDPVQLLVGAVRVIDVLVHEVVGTVTPFRITVPVELRKFWPEIVTAAPGATGEVMPVIEGRGTLIVSIAEADFVVSA
jgi:hypothetical protein